MQTFKIGFGYKARRGKDTACQAIVKTFGPLFDVRQYAFATALREEVNAAIFDRWVQDFPDRNFDPFLAVRHLCQWAGVKFDPEAPNSPEYPHGKQRQLCQWWGTEYRRSEDDDYWVKRLAARIEADKPAFAVISDMRFINEFCFCDYRVRMDRPGFEINDGAHHISECQLDHVREREWDHIIQGLSAGDVEEKAVRFFYSRFSPPSALPDIEEPVVVGAAKFY